MTAQPRPALEQVDTKPDGMSIRLRLGSLLIVVSAMALLLLVALLGERGSRLAIPAEGSAEVGFARDMALHHSQAVNMAQLLYDRTANPTLRGIALDIMLTQQAQIGQMGGWLDIWDLPLTSPGLPMAWMDMATEGLMPGMATDEQIAALRAASGVEADRLFIALMIPHHQAGIHMAETIIARTDNLAVVTLAESIVGSQQKEIKELMLIAEQLS